MSDSIWRGDFWKALLERAFKTFAQTAGSLLMADDVAGLIEVQWVDVASVSGLAALISVLFSIGGNAATRSGPSFGNVEVMQPAIQVAPGQASNLSESGNQYGNP